MKGRNVIGLVVEVDHQLPIRILSEHPLGSAAIAFVTKPGILVSQRVEEPI